MKSENEEFQIDPDDPRYAPLAKAADRIATILGDSTGNGGLGDSLDDFLGAIYGLVLAKHYGYKDRLNSRTDPEVVRKRARQVAIGRIRTGSAWMAGFYFNSALFRIDSVYHRVLKTVDGRGDEKILVGQLAPRVKKLYRKQEIAWSYEKLCSVHTEVNELKHTPQGVGERRTVAYQDALDAVEELLKLIEAWRKAPITNRMNGFPLLDRKPGAKPVTIEMINELRDED